MRSPAEVLRRLQFAMSGNPDPHYLAIQKALAGLVEAQQAGQQILAVQKENLTSLQAQNDRMSQRLEKLDNEIAAAALNGIQKNIKDIHQNVDGISQAVVGLRHDLTNEIIKLTTEVSHREAERNVWEQAYGSLTQASQINNAKWAALRERYLTLLQAALVGTIYEDAPLHSMGGDKPFDANLREHGWDWPSKAVTMVGTKRIRNFRDMIESVIGNNIPGDIIETGVWRGGASIMARAVLQAYEVKDRKIIVADSFEGLPLPDEAKYPADAGSDFHSYPDLAVSLEEVQDNFKKFGLLDDQVVFLKGWFKDTMLQVQSEKLAVMRLDGDMYESTIVVLDALYDRLSPGGWVIIDDYEVVPACKSAVDDFLAKRALKPIIHQIDGVGVYFQKEGENAPKIAKVEAV